MSTEEIINAWKNNEDDPDKLSKDKDPQGKPKAKTPANPAGKQEITDEDLKAVEGKTPANPVGEQEITDEDLKAVEGGINKAFSCFAQSC